MTRTLIASSVFLFVLTLVVTPAHGDEFESPRRIVSIQPLKMEGLASGGLVQVPLGDVIAMTTDLAGSEPRAVLTLIDGREVSLESPHLVRGTTRWVISLESLDAALRSVRALDGAATIATVSRADLVAAAERRLRSATAAKSGGDPLEIADALRRVRALGGTTSSRSEGQDPLVNGGSVAEASADSEGDDQAAAGTGSPSERARRLASARRKLIAVLREARGQQGQFSPAVIAAYPTAARDALTAAQREFRAAGGRMAQLARVEPELTRVARQLSRTLHLSGERPTLPDVPDALAKFVERDLTALAQGGRLDPVIGRDADVDRLTVGLSARTKKNVILVGEPGVGKTAIVEGLAQAIADGRAGHGVAGRRVLELSIAGLSAGTKFRGEFEERLKNVLGAISATPEADRPIIFIDEGHTILGGGAAEGGADAANIIKPALARGELHLVSATTHEEYRRLFSKDAALDRRFRAQTVEEPSARDAIRMVSGRVGRNEAHYKLKISPRAVRAAVALTDQYLPALRLPDKAHDVLEVAAAQVSARGGTIVTAADVTRVVQQRSGVPIHGGAADTRMLLELERRLATHVFGQDEPIAALADEVRRSRAQMRAGGARRPASAIFLGPTGVGKTELAKALARELFGDASAATIVDMNLFAEKHTVSNLIGSPNGYVNSDDGGRLTNAVRQRPYQVILLDEFEKAHPEVQKAFLSILDDGRATDRRGTVHFKNTIIIMTSNAVLEAPAERRPLGFEGAQAARVGDPGAQERALRAAMVAAGFVPELVNRIGTAALFRRLSARDIRRVVDKTVRNAGRRYGVKLTATDAAAEELVRLGTDKVLGARPVERAVATAVETHLARAVLGGSPAREYQVDVGADGRFRTAATSRGVGKGPRERGINPALRMRADERRAAATAARRAASPDGRR